MNKTIQLVNAWGEFEARFPNCSIEEFCRYYLKDSEANTTREEKKDLLTPTNTDSTLMRILGRIMLIHSILADKALQGTGIERVEEFSMLNAVYLLKDPKKSEAIQACLHEISTGTDILNRLKKRGYLTEESDQQDKRSKRVSVTLSGEQALTGAKQKISTLAEMLLSGMEEDDKKICIHLLHDIETRFTPMMGSIKGKRFDQLVKDTVNG